MARVQALLDEETTRRSLDTAKTAQTRLDSVLLRCKRLYAALGLQPSQSLSANLDSQHEVGQAKVSSGKSSDSDEKPQRKRQKVEGAKVRTFRPRIDLLSARRAECPPLLFQLDDKVGGKRSLEETLPLVGAAFAGIAAESPTFVATRVAHRRTWGE